MTHSPMRIVIADDLDLARSHLEQMIQESGRGEVAASISNGEAAVQAITELAPDLVFLDIQMPGLSGIEVVEKIGPKHMPPTIFVTAHDDYAVRAFELAAVDYLLKPFDDERFEQALDRAERAHRLGRLHELAQPLHLLLDRLQDDSLRMPQPPTPHVERFAVENSGELCIVQAEDVQHISASGHYAVLHTSGKEFLIRERMETLEKRLNPTQFLRIHRSAIVQLKFIRSLVREAGGDYALKLQSGAVLSVGRSRIDALEQWMGIAARR